ncbi:MAG: DUF309 domain-containing protein [Candidatus Caenarcaniphilales bacterium]|nr:DUF309 domain-containing protein [Candidatus Caenarcaniphilales bacterium]
MLVILIESVRLFNKGKFFQAHEQLEELWKSYDSRDRCYYQALIQLMVTCHLLSENRVEGAIKVTKRAVNNLKDYNSQIAAVDIIRLLKDIYEILEIATDSDNNTDANDKTNSLKVKLALSRIKIHTKDVIFYDDTCGFCSNLAKFNIGFVNSFGIEFSPLSNDFAQRILKLPVPSRTDEIKMFTQDFTLLSGIDVFLCILSKIPIFVPILWILEIPPVRSAFKRSYRLIAENRYKFNPSKNKVS